MNDLSTAYATQLDGNEGKTEWVVYNKNEEAIHTLPIDWTEKQVMTAIHLGRKFELKSFNEGITFRKVQEHKEIDNLKAIIRNLQAEKDMLIKENDKITTEIDKLIYKN